jgi:hypothetical protein
MPNRHGELLCGSSATEHQVPFIWRQTKPPFSISLISSSILPFEELVGSRLTTRRTQNKTSVVADQAHRIDLDKELESRTFTTLYQQAQHCRRRTMLKLPWTSSFCRTNTSKFLSSFEPAFVQCAPFASDSTRRKESTQRLISGCATKYLARKSKYKENLEIFSRWLQVSEKQRVR